MERESAGKSKCSCSYAIRMSFADSASIDAPTAARFFVQMAEATESCHSKHIIHRNIKRENILVGVDGRLRMGDAHGFEEKDHLWDSGLSRVSDNRG
jgi:serine/threonine protein kinase